MEFNCGFYKDNVFLQNLKRISEEKNWGLQYTPNGQLVVNEDTIDAVLHHLNDDRLLSEVTASEYNVEVKRIIA